MRLTNDGFLDFDNLRKEGHFELDNLIENVETTIPEISILKLCEYIIAHRDEWHKIEMLLYPFLEKYNLAYENWLGLKDWCELTKEGEDLIIYSIYNEIHEHEWQEEKQIKGEII